MRRVLVVGALLMALLCLPVAANQLTYGETVFNTNYVVSVLGLRDVGAGTITVSGVLGGVTKALLFWHGPTNSADPTANATVTFNGTSITGANIGFSGDNNWGFTNSQAYRADVTALVTGNGSYTLANFTKAGVSVNGVALFVFYNGGASKRDVVLYEGNDSNQSNAFDSNGWDFTLTGVHYVSGTANLSMYVSDGQDFGPNDDGTVTLNGSTVVTGGMFQGAAPKAPGAGVSNGSLTDFLTYDVTALMTGGTSSLHVQLGPAVSDLVAAVVVAFDLPAGAAPGAPVTVPALTPVALVFTAILLALSALFLFRSPRHQS
jgi:hypothetical protein